MLRAASLAARPLSSRSRAACLRRRPLSTTTEQRANYWGYAGYAFAGTVVYHLGRWWKSSRDEGDIRDALESRAGLIPHEIEELRWANEGIGVEAFEAAVESVLLAFPDRAATYVDFVATVQLHLEAPLEAGHLLDRVVVAALSRCVGGAAAADAEYLPGGGAEAGTKWEDHGDVGPHRALAAKAAGLRGDASGGVACVADADAATFDTGFLLSAFSLAVSAPVDDRFRAVHQLLRDYGDGDKISLAECTKLVGWLLGTDQIPMDQRIVHEDSTYPQYVYHEATACELVQKALRQCAHAKKPSSLQWFEYFGLGMLYPGSSGYPGVSDAENVTEDELRDLLSTKAVCAWGECHRRGR